VRSAINSKIDELRKRGLRLLADWKSGYERHPGIEL
jgi:biotin operon repressor